MVKELYEFKKRLCERGIFFSFSGPISQNLLVEIGSTLKKRMQLHEASNMTILRVFSLLVENAQNIIHYSAEKFPGKNSEMEEKLSLGILAVGLKDGHYFVMCGNVILNSEIDKLREKLLHLQEMSKEELKQYYKEQRKKEKGVENKGAGLGLIEIAKKASRPIEFDFKKIDDTYSFFSSKTTI